MNSLPRIKVVNVNDGWAMLGEVIARPSVLGNPFKLSEYEREDAIRLYEKFLRGEIARKNRRITRELNRLYKLALEGPLILVCYCAPKPCHGDVIKKILEEKLNETAN